MTAAPDTRGWAELDERAGPLPADSTRWIGKGPQGRSLVVIASLFEGRPYVSISAMGKRGPERVSDTEAEFALAAFDMRGASEYSFIGSNGIVRHFWQAPEDD